MYNLKRRTMFLKTKIKRTTLSNILIISFFCVLIISALISEFFQAPTLTSREYLTAMPLFSDGEIDSIKRIELKNKVDTFVLSKTTESNINNTNISSWKMVIPKEINVQQSVVDKLLNTISEITVKKMYIKDDINTSNFSLNTPQVEIKITNENNDEIVISIGLVNPIDNSTYLSISSKNAIYLANALNTSFESYTINDFFDSRIFTYEKLSEIQAIELFKGLIDKDLPQIKISRNNANQWIGQEEQQLDQEKVDEFLKQIFNLKGQAILDRIPDAISNRINDDLKNPLYAIQIKNTAGTLTNIHINTINIDIPEQKIEKGQAFVLKISDKAYLHVINKSITPLLQKTMKDFNKLGIKKIIH